MQRPCVAAYAATIPGVKPLQLCAISPSTLAESPVLGEQDPTGSRFAPVSCRSLATYAAIARVPLGNRRAPNLVAVQDWRCALALRRLDCGFSGTEKETSE